MAAALTDHLRDGLSMVYSFFHPGEEARSLGTYMILDHVRQARELELPRRLSGLLGAGQRQDGLQDPLLAAGSSWTTNGWERLD